MSRPGAETATPLQMRARASEHAFIASELRRLAEWATDEQTRANALTSANEYEATAAMWDRRAAGGEEGRS